MIYAAKPDKNQSEIVEDLRRLGYDVDVVHREKKMYDLIVTGVPTWARRAVSVRVEVKASEKSPLTPGEMSYWARQRHSDNLIKAVCTGDILKWFGAI